ncbi:MAG: acetyl-CoA carboxylase carboxyltransferase subunit alpha [Oscillospiraceae bacterium]|jgi:acetyl-CoA carboxylase carboxyl transferase subunit alpha|nr:acetyl-CoA carboxylase carboxyltransferase subunit alpha [Oscillospiraceae bacterium]
MSNPLTAWERIELIRNKNRPTARDYIPMIFEHFIEMHGDRCYGDDEAIIGGIGRIARVPVTIIAHVKGRNLEENKKTNFAMPHPEGYRKALRLMKQAEKFGRPVICLVDTPGAYCGIGAEERGQHEAIAKNLMEMMRLKTPILTIVLGEGGSGGALGLAVCDELAMLQNATYSVISPRGFASILWKDASREKEAANLIRITAEDLKEFGICDAIIPEPVGGAHRNPALAAEAISGYVRQAIPNFIQKPIDNLLQTRYIKFRKVGAFSET